MDNGQAYITGSCVIRDRRVYRNGVLLWEAPEAQDLQDLLRAGYDRFAGQYPKFHKMDPLSKLGWLAAEVLLQELPLTAYTPEQAGMVLTNRSASLDTDFRYYETVKDIPSPALFVYTLPNIVMGEISIRHGLKGENAFFTTDSFDTALVVDYVQQLFREGALAACLCGWVEVMGQQYEVILHLAEREARGRALPFTAQALAAAGSIEEKKQ